ncbi:MAG TPA: redoxin domain-containing protein [Caldilinea sp.]|nr:redoxin domain-containing protein [Caldilinea sp.]
MASPSVTVGAAAPGFELTALGSNRIVSLDTCQGTALLLAFHDQNSVAAVQAMQEAVRARYADAATLLVPSVVNMSAVPVFLRSLAEQVMRGTYAKAAEAMPPGLDVADYVVILLDWDGKVSKRYNARKIATAPLLTLIDGQGIVRGVHQGGDLALAALEMLDGVVPSSDSPPSPAGAG